MSADAAASLRIAFLRSFAVDPRMFTLRQRAVLRLHFVEGLSAGQIATRLKLSFLRAISHLRKAAKKLRRWMASAAAE